jgi:hypothetical protein
MKKKKIEVFAFNVFDSPSGLDGMPVETFIETLQGLVDRIKEDTNETAINIRLKVDTDGYWDGNDFFRHDSLGIVYDREETDKELAKRQRENKKRLAKRRAEKEKLAADLEEQDKKEYKRLKEKFG